MTPNPELREQIARAVYDAIVEPGAWDAMPDSFQAAHVERSRKPYCTAADAALSVVGPELERLRARLLQPDEFESLKATIERLRERAERAETTTPDVIEQAAAAIASTEIDTAWDDVVSLFPDDAAWYRNAARAAAGLLRGPVPEPDDAQRDALARDLAAVSDEYHRTWHDTACSLFERGWRNHGAVSATGGPVPATPEALAEKRQIVADIESAQRMIVALLHKYGPTDFTDAERQTMPSLRQVEVVSWHDFARRVDHVELRPARSPEPTTDTKES